MELRHLRYFCAVAEFGTFARAAAQLHVAQSAISEQIADLEREVGGALLDRSPRANRLSPQGEIFLVEARRTLQAAERALDLTRRSLEGKIGTLSIGYFLWGTGGFFTRIIREYRRLYPGVRLSLFEMHTIPQMDALTSGKIDIGFTRPLEPPYDRILRQELIYRDPIVAALPREHPLAQGTEDTGIPITALAGERFVVCVREVTPTLFDTIVLLCSDAGFSPDFVNMSTTWSGVLTLVESGEGIALVPSGVRHIRTAGVVFRKLLPDTRTIGIALAWSPANEGPIQRDFLALVRANKDRIQHDDGD